MTLPIKLPPPKDPYNRPARELAGYASSSVNDGDEIPAPTAPSIPPESISMLAAFGPCTLYQMAAALDPYTLAFKRTKYDASAYNYVRITVDVKAAGSAGSILRPYYSLSGGVGTFVSAGLTPIDCPLSAVGVQVFGGFIVGAASADVFWTIQGEGGDGVASPTFDLVELQFFLEQNITRPPVTRYFCPSVPGSEPAASVHSGGWVDVFGVNAAQPLGGFWNLKIWDAPIVSAPFSGSQAAMMADGWTFNVVNGGHGGWTFVANDEIPPNPAIARAGTIMLICLDNRAQNVSRTISLPPHAKGYVARGYGRFQGGMWTVVGYPGQCGPGWGPTTCGSGSFAAAICCLPIQCTMSCAGFSKSFVAAFYGMTYDLARPSGRTHVVIPPGTDGAGLSLAIGLEGGVGYGTTLVSVGGILIGVNEETEPPGSMCPSAGGSPELVETETDYDTKRAAGPLKRFVDDPLAAQTVPTWTYQVRIAAGVSTGARYAVGHVHARVYIWRESDDSVVAVLGDVTTPQLDATLREYDLAIAGAPVAVLDGDRFVVELSGSLDTPADAGGKLKTTESDGLQLEYNGSDASFSTGAVASGAAAHIVLPGVAYL